MMMHQKEPAQGMQPKSKITINMGQMIRIRGKIRDEFGYFKKCY